MYVQNVDDLPLTVAPHLAAVTHPQYVASVEHLLAMGVAEKYKHLHVRPYLVKTQVDVCPTIEGYVPLPLSNMRVMNEDGSTEELNSGSG